MKYAKSNMIVSLLMAFCFMFTILLGGCGSASTTEDKTSSTSSSSASSVSSVSSSGEKETVTLLSWFDETKMKPVIDGFQAKYPNISIDFQYAPPVKEYVEKLKAMNLTDSAPDIFVMCYENNNDIADGGYAEDLSNGPYINQQAQFNIDTYKRDGKILSYAPTAWVGGIYYNKDLFQKAGITKEPDTWAELLDDCKKLKDVGVTPFTDNMQDAAVNVISALYATETLSKNPKFDDEALAGQKKYSEGWTAPFQIFNDFIKKGYQTSDMLGIKSEQIQSDFATGKVAMILGGPWCISTFTKANPDFNNYKLIPIPGTQPNNKWYVGAAGIGYCVSTNSKVKDSAKKFVEYVSTPEGLELYNKGTGEIITAKGFDSQVPEQIAEAKKGLLDNKIYIPMGGWKQYTEAMRSQYVISGQDMCVGKIAPEDAAKTLDKKFEEMKNNN